MKKITKWFFKLNTLTHILIFIAIAELLLALSFYLMG